jgi:hypothetical protein
LGSRPICLIDGSEGAIVFLGEALNSEQLMN